MSTDSTPTRRERILGGLWGSLVGDALGVPVEFKDRATLRHDPVAGLRGGGTHRQPAGTWSDDSSLLLCTVDSLLQHTFDPADLGRRFVRWKNAELWTPHGGVFDIGIATSEALSRIERGVPAELAGGDTEYRNGNGSLMRILPVSLRFSRAPIGDALDRVHRASAITHRHPRSQMACGFYTLLTRALIEGTAPATAFKNSTSNFRAFYETDPRWRPELDNFGPALNHALPALPENAIASSGYVLDTLAASAWCFLTTTSFETCVLKAVNLGGDTDTTACVAGGLAGVHYGSAAIRPDWIQTLARSAEIAPLLQQFAGLCLA